MSAILWRMLTSLEFLETQTEIRLSSRSPSKIWKIENRPSLIRERTATYTVQKIIKGAFFCLSPHKNKNSELKMQPENSTSPSRDGSGQLLGERWNANLASKSKPIACDLLPTKITRKEAHYRRKYGIHGCFFSFHRFHFTALTWNVKSTNKWENQTCWMSSLCSFNINSFFLHIIDMFIVPHSIWLCLHMVMSAKVRPPGRW